MGARRAEAEREAAARRPFGSRLAEAVQEAEREDGLLARSAAAAGFKASGGGGCEMRRWWDFFKAVFSSVVKKNFAKKSY